MAPKARSSALQAQPPPGGIANVDPGGSSNGDDNAGSENNFSVLWILAIIVNILFVLFIFALLGYCLNKYKKRQLLRKESNTLSSVFGDKDSPLFRPRTLSRPYGSAEQKTKDNSNGSSSSSRLGSVSRQLLRKSSNRIADSNNQILMQLSEGRGQLRSVSPIRYDTPPLAQVVTKESTTTQQTNTSFTQPVLSSVYTIDGQLKANEMNPDVQTLINGKPIEEGSITTSGTKSVISFKNLTLISTRLKSEMSDSRVKLNALNYDMGTNQADQRQMDDISEENLKTITDDLESLGTDDEENDEDATPSSVSSRSFSLKDKSTKPHEDNAKSQSEKKREIIERLEQESNSASKRKPSDPKSKTDLNLMQKSEEKEEKKSQTNASETEMTIADSGFGDSSANLIKSQSNLVEKNVDILTNQAQTVDPDPFNLKRLSTSSGKLDEEGVEENQNATAITTAMTTKSSQDPMVVGSTREFSFNRTEQPEIRNESGAVPTSSQVIGNVGKNTAQNSPPSQDPLRQVSEKSKIIKKPGSANSRNGSGHRRLKSAGVQTTPSLRRAVRTPKESTFSPNYHEFADKTGIEEEGDGEGEVTIEEQNFYYDPSTETQERKYFIYLVSDTSSPYYRKDCIGKILLPVRGQLTLAELRDQLFKQSEDSVRNILKKSKNFRFLTETYRFVAQNEAIASVKEVYPTQGIFIKLSSSEAAMNYLGSRNKGRSDLPSIINALAEMQPSVGGSRLSVASPAPPRNTPVINVGQAASGTSSSVAKVPHAPPTVGITNRNTLTTASEKLEHLPRQTTEKTKSGNTLLSGTLGGSGIKPKRDLSPSKVKSHPTNATDRSHADPVAPSTRNENRFSPKSDSPVPPFLNVTQSSTLIGASATDRQAYLHEAMNRRHGLCLLPKPIVRRLPHARTNLIMLELRKPCQRRGCNRSALMKCAKCSRAYYCSYECKQIDLSEHRVYCQRPPWRL